MALKAGIYKCLICGNVVEVMVSGGGSLVCCGQEMKLMDEKTKEGAGEKHLPVIEDRGGEILVKVGSVPHPMEADHWIQFIEVFSRSGLVLKKELAPGEKPEKEFDIALKDVLQLREFCNKHGLWTINL